jgi:hypothetical protein
MVNIYRVEAEQLAGRKLGARRGKVVFFTPEEQEVIRAVQRQGINKKEQNQPQSKPDFSAYNNQAEDSILTGMDAIVQSGDQNAIAIGQALGQRWNTLLWSTALQAMHGGMVQMQQQFEELHMSVSLELSQPQLTSANHNLLEGKEDESSDL